jgi:hypothetical protein
MSVFQLPMVLRREINSMMKKFQWATIGARVKDPLNELVLNVALKVSRWWIEISMFRMLQKSFTNKTMLKIAS